MQRKAILIASSGSHQTAREQALTLWSQFLQSNAGGAWKEEQLLEAQDCKREKLLALIRESATAEFTLVVFTGIGKMVRRNVPWTQLELELADGEKILDSELNTGSPRCGMIVDASGGPFPEVRNPSLEAALSTLPSSQAYEREVERADRGLARIWALRDAEIREPSSSFSWHLATRAAEWAKANPGILYFQQAAGLVSECSERSGWKVEYRGGRRNHDLPFAVGVAL